MQAALQILIFFIHRLVIHLGTRSGKTTVAELQLAHAGAGHRILGIEAALTHHNRRWRFRIRHVIDDEAVIPVTGAGAGILTRTYARRATSPDGFGTCQIDCGNEFVDPGSNAVAGDNAGEAG